VDLGSHEVVTANRELLPGLLREHATLLIANEDEAAALTGLDQRDVEKIALTLGQLCRVAVLNLGQHGSLIAADGELRRIPANLVANPVDTTGAGDSWLAGFLYGWLNGQPLTVSGRCGAVLGAAVVQQIGAQIPDARWPGLRRQIAALG
jgi:sugar/nucleoside kinase (ribokinase family)